MTTRLLLSIDTEMTWRARLAGHDWRENLKRAFDAAGAGVPYQLEMLARHRLSACFFVDPMPAALFGIEPVRRMIAPILAAGQEVQLHLHPIWAVAAAGADCGGDQDMAGRPLAEQRALIERAIGYLRAAGAPAPIAFRAGNFGADANTLAAAAEMGIRFDTSHDACMAPHPCAIGLGDRLVAPIATHGLVELPVMTIEGPGGRLRHVQIGAVSFAETRAALLHAEYEGNPLVTIVGHGFELATRDGLRVNAVVKRRFDRLCAWLDAERERFPTVRLDRLDELPLDVPATPAPTGAVRRWARMATQVATNLVYEGRP